MINRVYYQPDGKVVVRVPASKARKPGESDAIFIDRVCAETEAGEGTDMKNLPFDDIDSINLPERATRGKWRGNKTQGVYVDNTIITEAERREAIQAQIDAELDKPIPNAGTVLKLQRDLKG